MKEFTSKSIPPLLASFLIFFVVFGLQFSWGIYQTHYVNHLRILPTSSSSSGASSLDDAPADSIHAETHKSSYPWISLIGTTAASFKLLFALVAGKLARNPISSTKTSSSSSSSTTSSSSVKWSFIRGFKGTVRLGGILLFIGLVGASFFISDELSPIQGTPRYLALILFQGVMVGIGLALAITPATAAPSEWVCIFQLLIYVNTRDLTKISFKQLVPSISRHRSRTRIIRRRHRWPRSQSPYTNLD